MSLLEICIATIGIIVSIIAFLYPSIVKFLSNLLGSFSETKSLQIKQQQMEKSVDDILGELKEIKEKINKDYIDLDNKIDDKIAETRKDITNDMTILSDNVDKKIDRLLNRLDGIETQIVSKIDQIAEKNKDFRILYEQTIANLKTTIVSEYVNKDDITKAIDHLINIVEDLPCKQPSIGSCTGKK